MKTLICFLAFTASMAAQTYVDAMFPWPNYRMVQPGTAVSMGTDEQVAIVVTAKKACSVSAVHFNLTAVTSAQSTTVTLQNSDASGYPDGTADQTATVATPAAGWNTATMGASRTVTAGDRLAINFAWTSTAGAMTFTTMHTTILALENQNTSYYAKYASSAWSKVTTSFPVVGLECDDGSFIPVADNTEPSTGTYVEYSSSSNPDEAGNRFQVPFPAKACGLTFYGRLAAGANADLVLYDSSANVLASCSTNVADTLSATATALRSCYFTTQQTLAADTTYYAIIKPTTTNVIRRYEAVFPTANAIQAATGGASIYKAYRVDAGSFSTTTTQRESIFVELCSVGTSSSGGGASAHTWVQ